MVNWVWQKEGGGHVAEEGGSNRHALEKRLRQLALGVITKTNELCKLFHQTTRRGYTPPTNILTHSLNRMNILPVNK